MAEKLVNLNIPCTVELKERLIELAWIERKKLAEEVRQLIELGMQQKQKDVSVSNPNAE